MKLDVTYRNDLFSMFFMFYFDTYEVKTNDKKTDKKVRLRA